MTRKTQPIALAVLALGLAVGCNDTQNDPAPPTLGTVQIDRMGRAGAARLKEHFLAGRMARELEEVYGALAKPHGSQRRMLW